VALDQLKQDSVCAADAINGDINDRFTKYLYRSKHRPLQVGFEVLSILRLKITHQISDQVSIRYRYHRQHQRPPHGVYVQLRVPPAAGEFELFSKLERPHENIEGYVLAKTSRDILTNTSKETSPNGLCLQLQIPQRLLQAGATEIGILKHQVQS